MLALNTPRNKDIWCVTLVY